MACCSVSRWGGWFRAVATPLGGVEDDCRCRLFCVGSERFGERLDELAECHFGFRGDGRRGAGDEEQGSGFCGGESGEVGAGPADEGPSPAAAGLGIHGDSSDGEGFEVAAGGAGRHFEFGGDLSGGDPAACLEKQQCGHEAVGAHDVSFSLNVDNRWPYWSGSCCS